VKLTNAWLIKTAWGDEIIVPFNDAGTINWAKRHGYEFTRIKLLSK
jgi:hypothetical protein